MKKIILILSTHPKEGGQHQYALLVVQCLLKKYAVVALCANSFWRRWCREHNIRILKYSLPEISLYEQKLNLYFPFISRLYYTYITELGRGIQKEKADILFSTRQGMFLPNYNIKIISPVHDLMHRYEPDFAEVKSSYMVREIYMKCFAKYTSCILVDSKLGGNQFKESYIKSRKKAPRIISLPFVAPRQISDEQEEFIDVPDKYFFYPAQFWTHKNHINLVKAIKILSTSIPNIHLVLVGSEKNCCGKIKHYITENKLNKFITILGFVSDGNITYLYKHAVALIMPTYFGPTNIPPLEAMSLGCPVAASNKYAMPEQIGDAGLFFDPDSPEEIAACMKALWNDVKLRERMVEAGYNKINTWTPREFSERLCTIIDMI